MPNLSLIPVRMYQPLDPYHHVVDNGPIEDLVARVNAVNAAVDSNTADIWSAAGNQGSLANRLNQSMEADGTIKVTAINNLLHSIEDHQDTDNYVRMQKLERDKLSMIAAGATNLKVAVSTISGVVLFDQGTMELAGSDSIQWQSQSGAIIPVTNFPASVRHVHYYGLVPVNQSLVTPDYQNFYVTSIATPYRAGSLRVFVNGVRLDSNGVVYVPMGLPSAPTYQALTFVEDSPTSGVVTTGGFTLSVAISPSARIIVDFDVQYA